MGSTNLLTNTRLNPRTWGVFPFVLIFLNLVQNVFGMQNLSLKYLILLDAIANGIVPYFLFGLFIVSI